MNIIMSSQRYEAWLHSHLGSETVLTDLSAKHEKMRKSPFTFLRATYWRWAEQALAWCPEFAGAPHVLSVGDIHLENFGTWRDAEGRLVFGVNDLDEAASMPWPLDLVRLAASIELARLPGVDRPLEALCAELLTGYVDGLQHPAPCVLDSQAAMASDEPSLLALLALPEPERVAFWKKNRVEKLATAAAKDGLADLVIPSRLRAALLASLPAGADTPAFFPRQAGAGSLGRPRWVAHALWRGGPVLREAKTILPSAWTRQQYAGATASRCAEVAFGTYRSPDPWLMIRDDIVVRRLSPSNRKLEAKLVKPVDGEVPPQNGRDVLLAPSTLHIMGADLAAIHAADVSGYDELKHDLERLAEGRLAAAATRAAVAIRAEFELFRPAG